MILEYLMAVRIEVTGDNIKNILDLKEGIKESKTITKSFTIESIMGTLKL